MPQFNTNRGYSAEGQIINYEITSVTIDGFYADVLANEDYLAYIVLFNDVTRGIDGYVEFSAHKNDCSQQSIQGRIMDNYDTGQYTSTNDKVKI